MKTFPDRKKHGEYFLRTVFFCSVVFLVFAQGPDALATNHNQDGILPKIPIDESFFDDETSILPSPQVNVSQPGTIFDFLSGKSKSITESLFSPIGSIKTEIAPSFFLEFDNSLLNTASDLLKARLELMKIAVLVSADCQSTGDTLNGSSVCIQTYSDGSLREIMSHYASLGDEFKRQSIITDFNALGQKLNRKSIRYKTLYNYLNNHKVKEADYFDIVNRPAQGKITREFIIGQYSLRSGKTKKMTWAKYRQIGDSTWAGISHHAVFSYDLMGVPLRGHAEKWLKGEITDTLLDWNSAQNEPMSSEYSNWREWENLIKTSMSQATHF